MPKRKTQRHDSEIEKLSVKQKDLRLQIANTHNESRKQELKTSRNQILHEIRRRCKDNAERELDAKAEEVEKLKDGAQMFQAVRLMNRRNAPTIKVKDSDGKMICNEKQSSVRIGDHFCKQFNSDTALAVDAFQGDPKPLINPVTVDEVNAALKRLNNGRAAGPDSIQGELLKYSASAISPVICQLLNRIFEILLTTLRKTMSLVVLRRISKPVNDFLSPSQSGFRQNRSTADIIWCHRWLAAKTQRYKCIINILGIDMSRAFDTIHRDRLLTVIGQFLQEDDVRLIRYLISNTHLQVRVGSQESDSFATTVGTPQGDSLSPILFIIYLEAALRDVRERVPRNAKEDAHLPFDIEYADDVDFLSTSGSWLRSLEPQVSTILGEWFLQVNGSKTEYALISREADRTSENWRMVKKLGSLLGDQEDVCRRKQLASAAFQSLRHLWKRAKQVSLALRIRLYNSFVLPVLTYNCGTWGITRQCEQSLEAFHRRQLRSILTLKWPNRISNANLYKQCNASPLGLIITKARWRLFGHILRSSHETPSWQAMTYYFQAPRTTLPTVLASDLRRVHGHLRSAEDLLQLAERDRGEWNSLVNEILEAYRDQFCDTTELP